MLTVALLACAPSESVGPAHLEALGYVDGIDDPSAASGVLVSTNPAPGWNLYGSSNSNEAFLLDADGNEVHSWTASQGIFSHVQVLPDGDLLVLVRHREVLRLRPDSTIRWRWAGEVHHDLHATATEIAVWVEPETLQFLNLDGEPTGTLDLSALGEHANHVEFLPDGRLLVSFRDDDLVAIVTKDRRVDWTYDGLHRQHHPSWVDGHILAFDNGRQQSRVVELDPETNEVTWSWTRPGFFSETRGSAQRLDNGHTLITESDRGYVHEVDDSGEVVWSWANPSREGDLRRAVWRMTRLAELPQVFR
ncbi:MAG: PQQ-binding-like beta-propeller repeat protein [Proteobacteria bacterium]|nr:PQQ-binding-like beta-propeller repeat protein [Pseudomonadota bacterium]MCP4917188.1 PQQ-binding-like beta-propeller repeat protein [Pseudomonadota bacterium]